MGDIFKGSFYKNPFMKQVTNHNDVSGDLMMGKKSNVGSRN